MRRIVTLFAVALAVCSLQATSASAGTTGSAVTDDEGVSHAVSIRIDIPASGGRPSTERPRCQYTWMDYPSDTTITNLDGTPLAGDGTGTFYMLRCDDSLVRVIYVRPGTPIELAEQAQRYLPLPKPVPQFSPATEQVVNLASWLWIDEQQWHPLRSTVSVPGVSVSVTAIPESIDWVTGEGTTVFCEGPATAYDPGDPTRQPSCSYTYRRSSARQPNNAYDASVTIQWHATWIAQGAAGGGDLGVLPLTTTASVIVGEVQAVNRTAN